MQSPSDYRVQGSGLSCPCQQEVIASYHRGALWLHDATTNLYIPTGPSSRPAPPAAGSPVYLDLAYLPGGSAGHLDQNFSLHVRALCYVISGQGQRQEEGLHAVLDACWLASGSGTLTCRWVDHRTLRSCFQEVFPDQPKAPGAWGLGALSPAGQLWAPCGVHEAEKCHQRGECSKAVWGQGLGADGLWLRSTL